LLNYLGGFHSWGSTRNIHIHIHNPSAGVILGITLESSARGNITQMISASTS